MSHQPALLALEDGSLFWGSSIGISGLSVGEVVFNTSMTGYQEILTDPSYAQQIITLTYPHIGNVGANSEDEESAQIFATGLVIRDLPVQVSNWRQQSDLSSYLQKHNVVSIADIDTRRLTRILREKGAQNGAIMAGNSVNDIDEAKALAAAKAFPGLKGMDLAKEVTTNKPYSWNEGCWSLEKGYKSNKDQSKFKVLAYDYGVKRNILRILHDYGCELEVIPATTPASKVLAKNPDGVFLSNGPGDPEPCDYAIKAIQEIIAASVPTFGICLGHQLLGLACGAQTTKMKFGHHGANHPVQDLASKLVMISSQNHGFAIDEKTLPKELEATHRSLFDGSLQGVRHMQKPAYSFQGHPEASPGPQDVKPLFKHFIKLMEEYKQVQ
ncbi:MAG: glutamine-hydrolyzing carbamoyl-phosphate synthase small subunit [Gammaproteobacteria bacterium]